MNCGCTVVGVRKENEGVRVPHTDKLPRTHLDCNPKNWIQKKKNQSSELPKGAQAPCHTPLCRQTLPFQKKNPPLPLCISPAGPDGLTRAWRLKIVALSELVVVIAAPLMVLIRSFLCAAIWVGGFAMWSQCSGLELAFSLFFLFLTARSADADANENTRALEYGI